MQNYIFYLKSGNVLEEILEKKKRAYHRHKRGRPKKRGRKKKVAEPKPKISRTSLPLYNIMLINHGKEIRNLYHSRGSALAQAAMKKLIEESDNVTFPVRYNNSGSCMVEAEYEIILIKKREDEEDNVTLVRDQYGRFVETQSSHPDWLIMERRPYNIEETFWVYGYHPRMQRKTYQWILDNLVRTDGMKTVVVYKNKVLFEHDNEHDLVICKNEGDAIRLYNEMEKDAKKLTNKRVFFIGMATKRSLAAKHCVEDIMRLTNWSKTKITRSSTRP